MGQARKRHQLRGAQNLPAFAQDGTDLLRVLGAVAEEDRRGAAAADDPAAVLCGVSDWIVGAAS